jgi:hypothetical protein
MARSTSLLVGISIACPNFYAIDTTLAEKYAELYAEVGKQAAAKEGKAWPDILRAEFARRRGEIDKIGDRVWCRTQRERPQLRPLFKSQDGRATGSMIQ